MGMTFPRFMDVWAIKWELSLRFVADHSQNAGETEDEGEDCGVHGVVHVLW